MLGKTLASIAAVVLICLPAAANNPFGAMLMSGGDADTTGMLLHMKLAREFAGEWGYVRIGGSPATTDVGAMVRTIIGCRAMHLIPVLTALRLPDSYYQPENRDMPLRDADGSLSSFGDAFEQWMREVYARGVTVPYFEFGNEVNGGFYAEHPEVYAEMCIAVSKALKRVDPQMSFGTAGMAGCALDFYDAMLAKVPELIEHVDHWGFHPYAVNHPPGYAGIFDNYGPDCHVGLVPLLRKHGVENPVLIATEAGYELGNQRDRRFPKLTEELRARYMAKAYRDYWVPDANVRAVMLFTVHDVRWQGWNGWDLVRQDFTLTPMYEAVRDLPKPKGSDYLPSGPCSLTGRIMESTLDEGTEGVLVWIRRPNGPCYAAATGPDGGFTIANVPEGTYEISAFRDGYRGTPTERLALRAGDLNNWQGSVERTGLVGQIEGDAGAPAPAGYTPSLDGHESAMDTSVKRSGLSSLRIAANGKPATVWQVTGYESVTPGTVYAAEVWVKTKGLVAGDGVGAALNVQVTDSYARRQAVVEVPLGLQGDNDWTPITAVFRGDPQARRLWVSLKLDAEEGTVWFDDLFVNEAKWPLPSAVAVVGDAAVSGVIRADTSTDDVFLNDAIVFSVPFGIYARTDYFGRYTLEGLPPGSYRIAAFHPDYASAVAGVQLGPEGASADLTLREHPVPASLANPGFEEPVTHPTWFSHWNKFGTTEGMQQGGWHKGIPDHPEGFSPHSGTGYYGAVAGSNIKDGGIFQTIEVEKDALYEVSAWSYTYQTGEGVRGDVANRLGVDPMGGGNPDSPYILWTPHRPSHKQWTKITLPVRPASTRMTIFLHHLQVQGLTFNCNLFDDVEVRKVGEPEKTMSSGG